LVCRVQQSAQGLVGSRGAAGGPPLRSGFIVGVVLREHCPPSPQAVAPGDQGEPKQDRQRKTEAREGQRARGRGQDCPTHMLGGARELRLRA